MMSENFKILGKYIKDMSSETPNVETFLFVKENISKYQLNINITSKALKNKLIEINTTLKFEDKEPNKKKSHYEKAKILRDHGMSKTKKYYHVEVGFNLRMTNIQAAIGVAQLSSFKKFLHKRSAFNKQINKKYDKYIS